jgi:hypothetical protein
MPRYHWNSILRFVCQKGLALFAAVALAAAIPVSAPVRAQASAGQMAIPVWVGVAPEMKRLHALSGLWRHEIEIYRPKKAEWEKAGEFFGRYDKSLGGFYLEGAYAVPLGGGAGFTNRLIMSYDKFRRAYRMVLFEDVVGLIDLYEGKFSGDSLTFTNKESGTYGPNMRGELEPVRMTYSFKGEAPASILVEAFRKGAWVNMMRFNLSKVGS